MQCPPGRFIQQLGIVISTMNESVVMDKSQFPFEVVMLLTFGMYHIPYIETQLLLHVMRRKVLSLFPRIL